jgi:hypothetical protein
MEEGEMTYLVIFGLALAAFIAYELYVINHNIIEIGKFLEDLKK